MLLWPGSTGRYFSWRLSPAPIASLVGAFYVASAIVFGWAAHVPPLDAAAWSVHSVLGLAAPTLVVTAVHREVFDFGRWQAVAWVFLFVASVTSFATLVARPRARRAVADRRPRPAGPGAGRPGRARRRATAPSPCVLWLVPARGLRARSDRRRPDGPAVPRLVGGVPRPRAPGTPASTPPGRRPGFRVAALVAFPIAGLVATVGAPRRPPHRTGRVLVLAALAGLAATGLSAQRAARRVVVPTTRGGAVR